MTLLGNAAVIAASCFFGLLEDLAQPKWYVFSPLYLLQVLRRDESWLGSFYDGWDAFDPHSVKEKLGQSDTTY